MSICILALAVGGFHSPANADCSPGNTGTAGNDLITCDATNDPAGADVNALEGNDTLDLLGGTAGIVDAGSGDDEINIEGMSISGNLYGGDGNDTFIINSRDSRIGGFMEGGLDAGAGDDTIKLLDGLVFSISTGDGNDYILLDGGFAYNYIDAGAGDDVIYWDEGLSNEVRGGDGSDTLTLDSYAYDGTSILDGGDDLLADDGYIDTLTFKLDHEVDGRVLRNWERIVINGSAKLVLTGELAVGGGVDADGNDLGLHIKFGGMVEFAPGVYRITGSVANVGTISLVPDIPNPEFESYDNLIIQPDANGNFGNYVGRDGRLWLNTYLGGDNSHTDLLTVRNDVSGHTLVRIYNTGAFGAVTTGDGIKVVEIDGDSPADAFSLEGHYVATDGEPATVAGAYAYTLHHNGKSDPNDGDWYLRSVVTDPIDGTGLEVPRWQPGAVLYESYAQTLRAMNQPGTLRQRVGNRFWMGSSFRDVGICSYPDAMERSIDGGGLWIRGGGRRNEVAPEISTSAAEWDQDIWQLQLGVDLQFDQAVCGGLPILGLFAQYSTADTDVKSFYGRGTLDQDSYGVGASLTWYDTRGTYADAQLHLNWFETDIESDELWKLQEGTDAFGYALSLEFGRSFKLQNYLSLTPQAQVIYSAEEADEFTDWYDVHLDDVDNDGFSARFGVALEHRVSRRKSPREPLERIGWYLLPNVIYNFDDTTRVNVSETFIKQDLDPWYAQLSLGATYDECADTCSIYGELNYATSIDNPGDSKIISLTIGWRYKW